MQKLSWFGGRTRLISGVGIAGILIGLLGMAFFAQANPKIAAAGTTRSYFIAADVVDWDYAPLGRNAITGQPFDDTANVFVQSGPDRIGKVYRKSIYREYTDATFKTLKPVPPEWKHLGLLGPVIHAEVGDSIVVTFKNNTKFPASIHPHGVFYNKDAEGAPYADGTNNKDKGDDAVPPGKIYTYKWDVPERAGPGPGDPSSVLWMYHSHTDEVADTYSGLVGAMIVTARGQGKPDGSPKDVDRELVTMFQVMNENNSLYLDENIDKFTSKPAQAHEEAANEDEEFGESNLMHAVNGYVYGNIPGLNTKVGEKVRWYVIALGTEVDLHTPHWHGNTLLLNGSKMGMRTDMTELLPGSMKILDMQPDDPGTWLFHCHVNDHITAGMMATYTVTK